MYDVVQSHPDIILTELVAPHLLMQIDRTNRGNPVPVEWWSPHDDATSIFTYYRSSNIMLGTSILHSTCHDYHDRCVLRLRSLFYSSWVSAARVSKSRQYMVSPHCIVLLKLQSVYLLVLFPTLVCVFTETRDVRREWADSSMNTLSSHFWIGLFPSSLYMHF